MLSHAMLARQQLSAADNAALGTDEIEAALERATRGLALRCRLEVAAVRVYAGPLDSSIPAIESLPLRPTPLARVLGELADRRRTREAAAVAARPSRPGLARVNRRVGRRAADQSLAALARAA